MYEHWGSRTCGTHATRLYEGFMAAPYYSNQGGGSNYLCMHPDPTWPNGAGNADNSDTNQARLYGVEYESVSSATNRDAACAMCMTNATDVYVQWGRTSCTNGHVTEYWGLIMAQSHSGQYRTTFVCVDTKQENRMSGSTGDHDGALLYRTEFESHGATNNQQYPANWDVACAVCSVPS